MEVQMKVTIAFITLLGCLFCHGPQLVDAWMVGSSGQLVKRHPFTSKFLSTRASSDSKSMHTIVGTATTLRFRKGDTTDFVMPDFLKQSTPTIPISQSSRKKDTSIEKRSKQSLTERKKVTRVKPTEKVVDNTPLLEGYYNTSDPDYRLMTKLRRDASFLKVLSNIVVPTTSILAYSAVPSSRIMYKAAGAAVGGSVGLILRKSLEDQIYKKEYDAALIDSYLDEILEFPQYINDTVEAVRRLPGRLVDYDLITFEKLAREHQVPENKLSLLFPFIFAEAVNQIVDSSMDLTDIADILDFIKRLRFPDIEVANGLFLVGDHITDQLELHEDGFTKVYNEQVLAGMSLFVFLVHKTMGGFHGYFGKRLKVFTGMFLEEHLQRAITILAKGAFASAISSILDNPEHYSKEDMQELKSFFKVPLHISLFREEDMQQVILDTVRGNIRQQFERQRIQLDGRKQAADSENRTTEKVEVQHGDDDDAFDYDADDDMLDYYEPTARYIKKVRKDVAAKAKINNLSKISTAGQKVFDLSEREIAAVIEQETVSYFQQTCNDIVYRLMENPDISESLAAELMERRQSLGILTTKTARSCYLRAIRQKINRYYLKQIDKVYKTSRAQYEEQAEKERNEQEKKEKSNNKKEGGVEETAEEEEYGDEDEEEEVKFDQTSLEQVFKIMLSYVNVFEGLKEILEIAFPPAVAEESVSKTQKVTSSAVPISMSLSGESSDIIDLQLESGMMEQNQKKIQSGRVMPSFNTETDFPSFLTNIPFPQLPFTQEMRSALFEYKVTSEKEVNEEERRLLALQQRQGGLSPFNTRRLRQLRNKKVRYVVNEMFQLSNSFCEMMRKVLELPKITIVLDQIIKAKAFHEHSHQALQKFIQEFEVKKEDWEATKLEYYYREVEKLSKSKAIPTLEDMQFLQSMRKFLQIPVEQVRSMHLEFFGEKYTKALLESMNLQIGSGGIPRDYHEGLIRLRDRLELSAEDGEYLLSTVMRENVLPTMITNLLDLMKMDQDPTYRFQKEREEKEKDRKEKELKNLSTGPGSKDVASIGFAGSKSASSALALASTTSTTSTAKEKSLAPNSFMREITNLIDSVIDNYLSQQIDIRQAPEMLPITISDLTESDNVIALFKHFLLKRLTENDEKLRKRYQEMEKVLCQLFGLTEEEANKVKQTFALETYTSILQQALQRKDNIGQEELQQFAIIVANLPLNEKVAERIFEEANGEAFYKHAQAVVEGEGLQKLTPQNAKRLRKQVQSMGMDWIEDLRFTPQMVGSLFALEIQHIIENEHSEEFTEVQEGYRVDSETASTIVELVCKRYVSQLLSVALGFARRLREEDVVKWTDLIVKYAKYFDGQVPADGTLFNQDDKQRLISYYLDAMEQRFEAAAEEAEASGQFDEDQFSFEALNEMQRSLSAKLHEMIHLDPTFVPSEYGMNSFLGEGAPTLNDMQDDVEGSFALGKKGLG